MGYGKDAIVSIEKLDFNKHFLFHVGEKPYDVEVFNFISGVEYEQANKHKVKFEFSETLPVFFISYHDLIINKMISGRLKDKLDVEELQRIEKLK